MSDVWVDTTSEHRARVEKNRAAVIALIAHPDVTDVERPILARMLSMADADVARYGDDVTVEELRGPAGEAR